MAQIFVRRILYRRTDSFFGRTPDAVLREKIVKQKQSWPELTSFGEEDDAISEKIFLSGWPDHPARNVSTVIHLLNFHLRDDFLVPHVALRLLA